MEVQAVAGTPTDKKKCTLPKPYIKEFWYFAIMDVINILAQANRARKYWNDLKTKLKQRRRRGARNNRTTENATTLREDLGIPDKNISVIE